jgi:hypothetical protein
MCKIIIAGSRTFNDYNLLIKTLKELNLNITEIVSGTAKGADSLGEKFATENNIPIKKFPPNWSKYHKSAGVIRNQEMIDYGDVLIAFWDRNSKGTQDSINRAQKSGKKVFVIEF